MSAFFTMLHRGFFASALCAVILSAQAQEAPDLNFEKGNGRRPLLWQDFGTEGYEIGLDSTVRHEGRYSAKIRYADGDVGFRAWGLRLPEVYVGQKITLSGYLKTENVADGWAGLWMRLDPARGFDNMKERGIKGNTNWTRYEITLDLNSEKTEAIVVGGLLAGTGSIWIDDLQVSIDGKDLSEAQAEARQKFATGTDTEFDKGSGVESITLNEARTENLYVLGLVWGFLKYYHPAVAAGNYHWDYELFRVLPKVLAAQTAAERDDVLLAWVQSLGKTEPGKNRYPKAHEIKFSPDLDWIKQAGLTPGLTKHLLQVKDAQRTGKNHYVSMAPGVGNPEFRNEKPYAEMPYPDAGYRLLALYRYWNIIHYYFPYKHLIGEDWKGVLKGFIPRFAGAASETEYKLACLELIARVHDTHANIWGRDAALREHRGTYFAPLEITFVENRATVTDYYTEELGRSTGMRVGDVLTHINGKPVETLVQEKLKYTPASNYPTQLRDIAPNLLRSRDSVIRVQYLRDGVEASVDLKAYTEKKAGVYNKYLKTDTCFRLLKPDIAYLYLGSIKNNYWKELWPQIKNTKGLVIDLRCYPSEFVVFSLGGYLLPKSADFVKFTNGSIEHPGLFVSTRVLAVGSDNPEAYTGKVMILVNETTQSQAEYTTMALRTAPRAMVLGSTTAGADGNVSQFSLPGNVSTMISGIGIYYPDGRETQRIGIVPDVEVKPTLEGIKAGRDEVLEKAIELIEAP